MMAFSALTAHKPPVRNRELVTGQIIARNALSSFLPRLLLSAVDSCPHHHAGGSPGGGWFRLVMEGPGGRRMGDAGQ
jgi:hypothetical protein